MAASATKVAMTWAVLDESGRVVVLFEGDGAWLEAQDWASRGYLVKELRPQF